MNSIITLTTDFGLKDYYLAAVKGFLSENLVGQTSIIDITHLVSPFDINEAAYILGSAYKFFPTGSIHIVGVDTEKTSHKKHLAIYHNQHYFIGADNGVFSILFENEPSETIVEISQDRKTSFATLDVFCKAAVRLAKGEAIENLGTSIEALTVTGKKPSPIVRENPNSITGAIIYFDRYGNAITNISKDLVENKVANRGFKIYSGKYEFESIYDNFIDIESDFSNPNGRGMVVYNAENYLMIALYRANPEKFGGAESLLGLKSGTSIVIEY